MKFGIPIAILIIPALLLCAYIYKRYLRVSWVKAGILFLAAVAADIVIKFYMRDQPFGGLPPFFNSSFQNNERIEEMSDFLKFLLPFVAIPFLAKLYLTWIAGNMTDAEKAPGMDGVRAWLRGGNLLFAILISLCLWLGYGFSFWSPIALALMALLAFPIINLSTNPGQPPAPTSDTLSPERERVLKMLDDGKITAQESAELLNALGHSIQSRPPPSATPIHRKMVLIGLVLVIIGFFLPWFAINIGDLQKDTAKMLSGMMQNMPNAAATAMLPQFASGMTVYITGGNIANGLGWCVLLLGIVAAALPFVATNLDSRTSQKTSLIILGAGAIIIIYLLTQNIRFTSIGLLLGVAGYALEFIGILKSRELDWIRTV